ncbi:MAG: nitroreductase family protein [Chloroflexota bacterium]|nr:nitroreductase family protein [Chloroflexota bacterium]
MNETIQSILGRRSIRRYKSTQVDKATIETILRAGMASPTASNRQPWELLVITSREGREKLARAHSYAQMLLTAPVCIVVCGNRERFYPEREAEDFWVQDCSALTENMLVAAQSLGLGTCWCGVYPRRTRVEAVSKALGLPQGIVPLNLVALGYGDEDPPVKDKWRPDRIHWETW